MAHVIQNHRFLALDLRLVLARYNLKLKFVAISFRCTDLRLLSL